jgi:hypothetical protein
VAGKAGCCMLCGPLRSCMLVPDGVEEEGLGGRGGNPPAACSLAAKAFWAAEALRMGLASWVLSWAVAGRGE